MSRLITSTDPNMSCIIPVRRRMNHLSGHKKQIDTYYTNIPSMALHVQGYDGKLK
jgi:hypothetical protein